MKKIASLFVIFSALIFTSCETTKEITFKDDGSGTLTTTTDMSSLISMAKMAGQGQDLDKMGDKSIDTSISTEAMLGEFPDLSPEDKELMKKGTVGLSMDPKNDKLITKLSFPFTETKQAMQLDKVSAQVVQGLIKKLMDSAQNKMPPGVQMPTGSIDDYYTTTSSKGLIERKLNKEKYANVDKDQEIQALKQMAGMGMGGNTLIFNLPTPAKKAEGKKVTLSEDKKKVTIVSSAEDFFDNGASLEFRIEY